MAMDGKVAEGVAIARLNAGSWHVGHMTNWNAVEFKLDFRSFQKERVKLSDGRYASHEATDDKKEL
jgi:alpha-glucosidase